MRVKYRHFQAKTKKANWVGVNFDIILYIYSLYILMTKRNIYKVSKFTHSSTVKIF